MSNTRARYMRISFSGERERLESALAGMRFTDVHATGGELHDHRALRLAGQRVAAVQRVTADRRRRVRVIAEHVLRFHDADRPAVRGEQPLGAREAHDAAGLAQTTLRPRDESGTDVVIRVHEELAGWSEH